MPVFDFSGASDKKPGVQSECTYTTFQSNEQETSPEKSVLCGELCAATECGLTNLINCISFLLILSGKTYIDVILSKPFQKAYES